MGNQTSTMNENTMGTLKLTIGCMYAGKTSRLIYTYNNAINNGDSVIVVTHSSENRYSVDEISTHDQNKIYCVKYTSIKSFVDNEANAIEKSDIILIDEGQFFDDLLEVLTLVEVNKKKVHVFGLDGDFKRNKFGKILDLIPLCDSIEKITANCKCGNDALFSDRTINNESQILVGSNDLYQPLCRKCYIIKNQK